MFDLLIRGERVVTPHGVGPWEIGVKDGVIAALGAPGHARGAGGARHRRRRAASSCPAASTRTCIAPGTSRRTGRAIRRARADRPSR